MDSGKTILLIDDDRDFVASTQELLEVYGYTVLTAYDGMSGFETAKRERPNLIILDVMMSYATEGFEIAKQIRELPELRELQVLLVSAITPEMKVWVQSEADNIGFPVDQVLEKPIDPAKFIAKIEEMLKIED